MVENSQLAIIHISHDNDDNDGDEDLYVFHDGYSDEDEEKEDDYGE